jgi:DNA-binding IscR family transcriptional regulator
MILPQKGVLTVLSSTAEYALRAVLFLAQHPERCPIRAGELAAALRVPPTTWPRSSTIW